MIKSMTGYGRGEETGEEQVFTIEMRSVNHRFLETVVRMPRQYNALEDSIKKTIAQKVSRGRVDVYISVENQENKNRTIKVDKELALAYYNGLKELGQTLEVPKEIELLNVAQFSDVIKLEEDEVDVEKVWLPLRSAVKSAVEKLVEMRKAEGERLKEDLVHRINKLEDIREQIHDRAPNVVLEYKEKLKARIKELMENIEVDESKLATEVAFFADRSNITEELVRLKSHFSQLKENLESSEPIGRKLDFLVQELNREFNTIGSKANDLTISNLVIEGKSEVEKIREQVQNIE